MGFLKSLFSGNTQQNTENDKQKNIQKKFDIFKYDGMRAQRAGQIDFAIKFFTEAIALQKDFEAMNYLSQAYIQKGELDDAGELLQEMLELEPEHTETYLILANINFMQEKYEDMGGYAKKVIELQKENASAHYLLGKSEHYLKNDIMAIASLTQAIQLKNNYTEALLLRADILISLNQYKEAAEDVDLILKENAEDEAALLLRAQIQESTGNGEEAEKDYLYVIELNPFNEQAYLKLGKHFTDKGEASKAIELYNEAVELNPNFTLAYHERGRAKLINGDKDGSIEDLKKALELDPKGNENLTGKFENSEVKPETIPGIF
jgi:Putative Zn-dependent protease, contains TPR repeats